MINNRLRKILIVLFCALCILCTALSAGCFTNQIPPKAPPHVTYEEYGAKGDGKTDDFEAIKAAHKAANELGYSVIISGKPTYYIGPHEDTVTVKTDVDWGKAKFIIDDKSAQQDSQEWWYPLFDVRPDTDPYDVELPKNFKIKAGQANVGLTFEGSVLLHIVNADKKDFIRYGANEDGGDSRQEVIIVDSAGNVDKSTPIIWDYDKVTKLTAYPADERPIILSGGTFTTVANDDTKVMHYFNRAIDVKRSNVTVNGTTHYVEGEGDTGSPYNGFFRASYCNNVTFINCVMTGHKTYKNNGVSQGTYDTRLNCSNNIKYFNCTQANDISDTTYWGIMCSDYCKNVTMEGCTLSRFDAHKGVYNATVKNSTIGQNISVVGWGEMLLEGVTRLVPEGSTGCNRFMTLRDDYGSFWHGNIKIKDCTLETYTGLNYAVSTGWHNWDYGFKCAFPQTVTLDNVKINYLKSDISYKASFVFSHTTENESETVEFMRASKNPMPFPDRIIIENAQTEFQKTANKFGWFDCVPMTGEQHKDKLGVWWWDKNLGDEYLDFAKDNGITEIYYCSSRFDDSVDEFIKKAESRGIKVFWLAGEYQWVESPDSLDKLIEKYVVYQRSGRYRFSGIHLDIEPHQHPEFKSRRAELIGKLCELVYEVSQRYGDIDIAYDIPFWLEDEVKLPQTDSVKPAYQHILDWATSVTLMSYRDTAEKIYSVSSEEIAYARQIGKPINLGVNTKSSEGDQVSFMEEGKQAMYAEIAKLRLMLPSDYGVIIHQIKHWYDLQD